VGADWSTGKPQTMHSRNMLSISHFVSLSDIQKGPIMFTNVDAKCSPQRQHKAMYLCKIS
jgi:hypothetical protein